MSTKPAAGQYVQVAPSGSKLWRWKYRLHGKEKKLALGTYPAVGLAEARKRRDDAMAELGAGEDPSREKRRREVQAKVEASNPFGLIAAELIEKRKRDGERPPLATLRIERGVAHSHPGGGTVANQPSWNHH